MTREESKERKAAIKRAIRLTERALQALQRGDATEASSLLGKAGYAARKATA